MIVDTPKLNNLKDGLRASDGNCTHDAESNGSAGRLLNYCRKKIYIPYLGYAG